MCSGSELQKVRILVAFVPKIGNNREKKKEYACEVCLLDFTAPKKVHFTYFLGQTPHFIREKAKT